MRGCPRLVAVFLLKRQPCPLNVVAEHLARPALESVPKTIAALLCSPAAAGTNPRGENKNPGWRWKKPTQESIPPEG